MSKAVAIVADALLPSLVKEAAAALARASSAAEVLAARDMATATYDAAKRSARLQRAKAAHDELVSATYRVQADSLEIESLAKRRLADEFDAAQQRGEIAQQGRRGTNKVPTAEDIGTTRKQIFDARQLRDAIARSPRALRTALDEILERGAEPTRALLRRELRAVRASHSRSSVVLDANHANEHRLLDGRNLFRVSRFELDALIVRARREAALLSLVRDHVANNTAPDTRVGDYLTRGTLDRLIGLASEGDGQ